jgi:hypothetical protein
MLVAAAATIVAPAWALPADPGWREFSVPSSGTRVNYPANIFSVDEGPLKTVVGERLRTSDGRAHLMVFTIKAEKSGSPAAFVARNLKIPRAALDYRRVSAKFFALSGVRQGRISYIRCNEASGRSVLDCIYLIYPAAEKRAWDPIVTRISLTLRP